MQVACPKCTQLLQCPDNLAGQVVACPKCQQQLVVPAPNPHTTPFATDNSAARSPKTPFAGLDSSPRPRSERSDQPESRRRTREPEDEDDFLTRRRPPNRQDRRRPREDDLDNHAACRGVPAAIAAEVEQLGVPVDQFSTNRRVGLICLIFGALLGLGDSLALAFTVLLARRAQQGGSMTRAIVVEVLLLLIAGGLLFLAYRAFRSRLIVFRMGMLQRAMFQTRVCRWDDIKAVWFHVFRLIVRVRQGVFTRDVDHGKQYSCELMTKSGQHWAFVNANVTGIEELCEAILEETGDYLMDQALESLRAGREVDFDPVIVSPLGLSCRGNRQLPWPLVGSLESSRGKLYIFDRDGTLWDEALMKDMPNAHVFTRLIAALGGKGLH